MEGAWRINSGLGGLWDLMHIVRNDTALLKSENPLITYCFYMMVSESWGCVEVPKYHAAVLDFFWARHVLYDQTIVEMVQTFN